MKRLIVAIVSIYDDAQLLPHFLDHYRRLGVARLFLAVRRETVLAAAELAVKAAGFGTIRFLPAAMFSDADKAETEESILAAEDIAPDDLVLHLDLDEFHEYPAALTEIAEKMERHGGFAVRGTILDRIAADGRLTPVAPSASIWEQFPIAADFTAIVLRGCASKVMICRRRVRLANGGRHDTIGLVHEPPPVPGAYRVHHFKWIEGVDRRLEQRLARDSLVKSYRKECRRFLLHFNGSGDRVDVGDARLNMHYPTPPIYSLTESEACAVSGQHAAERDCGVRAW
jgi:hypothetical protein